MENTRIWGLIILVLLVLSLVAGLLSMAGINSANVNKEQTTITKNFNLTDAQLAGVNRVNINYVGNVSSFGLRFNNQSDNLYNINIERPKTAPEPNVTYVQNGDVLEVNVTMDQGTAGIILGNRAIYNGNFQTKIGGYGIYLGNNSKVENINTNIQYIGGGMLVLGNTTFQRVDMSVNTGGFMINTLPGNTINGTVTTNIVMGGTNLQLEPNDNTGVKVKGTVDMGGFNFDPKNFNVLTNSTTQLDMESANYNSTSAKLILENNLGLGGLNLNTFNFFPMSME